MSFEGKTVLVTGAAGNLGKAVCAAFSEAGASIVLIGQDEKVLNDRGRQRRW